MNGWFCAFIYMLLLIALNEFSKVNKWTGIFMWVILPVCFSVFAIPNVISGKYMWFTVGKAYAALAGSAVFLLIRYNEKVKKSSFGKWWPAFILAFNILMAVVSDFQEASRPAGTYLYGMELFHGGPYNIINAIAGIFNILIICGWSSICISKDSKKEMLWPDMMWFYIIAYDIWNYTYVLNWYDSAYSGLALLLAATIPSFLWSKGAWLENRANTLVINQMIILVYPFLIHDNQNLIRIPYQINETFYYVMAILSLAVNVAVFLYQLVVIIRKKKNPLKDELYADTKHSQYIKSLAE